MQKPVLSHLFGLLEAFGVKRIVCSPGSRNAALIQQADAHKDIRKYVVVDERSAAFAAFGMALVSKAPVALICTSGSAVLNYAPAVAEAFYQGVPIIVISADRPSEWIDQDDSQTIRQPGVLANISKASYDLDGDRTDDTYLWYTRRIINEGMLRATTPKEGPVHFNVRLDGHVPSTSLPYKARKIEVIRPPQLLQNSVLREFAECAKDKKVMLVAGFMQPDHKVQKAVSLLSSLPNVAVLAETISNLHLERNCFMIDSVLFPVETEGKASELAPDIVISLGGALVSRKLKEFLRTHRPSLHWSLSYADNLVDCFQALTSKIECSPASFIRSLAKWTARAQKNMDNVPQYAALWNSVRNRARKDIGAFPWSDLKAMKIVLDKLPEDTNLFLSNGTSVRYGQIIPYRLTHATFSNRGVSGIEGCSSTAVGGSLVYDKLTCLITGDTSFAYDLGALSSGLADSRMRIVVLDNGGGDIFRFINATRNLSIREKYLCADQQPPFEMLAAAYGWEYFHAETESVLHDELEEFFSPSLRPAILHVDTSSSSNSDILRGFLS